MAKRSVARRKTSKIFKVSGAGGINTKINFAWKNLALFLVLFLFSGVFYGLSQSELFINFFGILSIIFAFLSFAFLIVLIVLLIVRSGRS